MTSKRKQTRYIILLIAVCIFMMGGCGKQSEDISQPLPSEIIQSSPILTPIPTVAPQEDLLGFEIPKADQYGMREYIYQEQTVIDWLGDFPRANAIRNILLDHIDGKTDKSNTFWKEFYIFLGIPQEISEGWLVPAGKRFGGEWMPDVYYISDQNGVLEIKSATRNKDVWSINQSHVDAETNHYAVFYGLVPVNDRIAVVDENEHPLKMDAVFSNGETVSLDVPPNYPYFLAVAPYGERMVDVTVWNLKKNNECALELHDGGAYYPINDHSEIERILHNNFYRMPMYGINSNMGPEEMPALGRIGAKEPYNFGGDVYSANLSGKTQLKVLAYAPLEQSYKKYVLPAHVGSIKNVAMSIDGKEFGEPSAVTATLFTPNGKIGLAYKDGMIDVGTHDWNGNYMLYVRAEFNEHGYIEWITILTE